ncbi:MAG: nitroreductase family protein [Desulfobulbaceae bacterium]|jgi:nitroreductase|nr:nitroreductase family protein [Desulfobulbaceae bacterium]
MENELMKILKTRRSIRRFKDQAIEAEKMAAVLDAVRWSPSWANTQCWEVVVVSDMAVKEKLQATLVAKNPATKAMVGAPAVLVMCGKEKAAGWYDGKQATRFPDWLMFDLGIASQSICLAAQSFGLGTVIVGLFDHAKADAALGLPPGYQVVAMIPIGYPDNDPSPPKRRETAEFTHHEKF